MNPKAGNLIARAGIVSAVGTAFAPVVGTALTGHGAPWLALPVGSFALFAGGLYAERRAALTHRHGVIVSDPQAGDDGTMRATAPRDQITVEYRWSTEDAA